MNPSDPLAKYRLPKSDEESLPKQADKNPVDLLAKYRQKGNDKNLDVSDPISEAQQAKGIEPDTSEEFERLYEKGQAEALKGILSGVTGGLSRLIPGAKPKENIVTTANEAIGSILPIGAASKGVSAAGKALFSKPLLGLAAKSPKIAKGLSALGGLTGVGLTGAGFGALDEATESGEFKAPSIENAITHGASWAALDAGLSALGVGGRFVKGVIKKARATNKSRTDIINETLSELKDRGIDISTDAKTAETALSVLEDTPISQVRKEIKLSDQPQPSKSELVAKDILNKDIQSQGTDLKTKKIKQESFDKLDNTVVPNATPYFSGEFTIAKVAEESIDKQITELSEGFSPRAATKKELGENIQASLEDSFVKAKKVYDPLYEKAQKAAEKINITPEETARKAGEMLRKLEGYKVNPTGYKTTIKEIENVLEDAGFAIRRSEEGAFIEGVQSSEDSVAKLMELKRRLNKMANFDNIEPSIQSLLGSLSSSVKQDILKGLSKNPEALEAFQSAEKKFGETAEKFKKKSIKSARYSEKPEGIGISNASELENLKAIVSPEQYKQIERELLEKIKGMNLGKANGFYREVRPQMGGDARFLAEEILESKKPSRTSKIQSKIQEKIFDDLARTSLTGERPDAVMKYWKTPQGQQIIKNSLKGNPNEKQVLKYLEEQSLSDFSTSVVSPEGTINFDKFNKLLKDPATLENLRLMGGSEGVQFFKQLEEMSGQIEKVMIKPEPIIKAMSSAEKKAFEENLSRNFKEKIEAHHKKLTPEQLLFKETYEGKSPLIDKQLYKENTAFAREKFRDIRKQAEEDRLRNIFFKFEDFLDSYGKKGKAVLALLGIAKFRNDQLISVGLGYEALKKLLTSKSLQKEYRKAAASAKSGNINETINALTNFYDDFSQED